MDQGLNQKIDAYIAENKEQLLQDIAALVAIDSVEGTPEEGAPFGKGPRAALDKTLELAAGMGLATRNCENYMGYAELAVPLALPFWVEGGMVVLQVLSCRWKGRPLFAAAPLHCWLEKRGMSAVNIFYSLCALSVCGLALAVCLARWA